MTRATFAITTFDIDELDEHKARALELERQYWSFTAYYDEMRTRIHAVNIATGTLLALQEAQKNTQEPQFYVARMTDKPLEEVCCVCARDQTTIDVWRTGIIKSAFATLPTVSDLETSEMRDYGGGYPLSLCMCRACFRRVWAY